jgi:hypothetical protein
MRLIEGGFGLEVTEGIKVFGFEDREDELFKFK